MEMHFFGTGAAVPSKERNVTALALRFTQNGGNVWLFDCGEATQHQILRSTITLSKIDRIFITHLHGDHIFGLPGLLGSRSFQGGDKPLTLYGPPGIKRFVDAVLSTSGTHLRYPLEVIEIEEEGKILENSPFSVCVKKLEHGIDSFGFRVEEADQPGPLKVEKLKEMGVSPGPLYRKLKEGKKVRLDDGRTLNGKEFRGHDIPGRKIAIHGDTRMSDSAIELSRNADLVVHEATFSKEQEELAYDYYHSTTEQAASVAKKANAKRLIITHISSRYQEEDVARLLKEAKSVFENTEIASDDAIYEIPKNS
ncbi:ribonuclease Z [Pseudalkalibacillus caeni]|uniref:Ribonuclease Z n=1 Tax=Exobacillus caeni TaxID=2574798 RepID=A0A5R9F1S9_9BACL|nr:ribonuclease Z [Pseudalkalibacillus caeni]TLS36410.1 ribonuclease Z [Pseudalkalibacillus caeni]